MEASLPLNDAAPLPGHVLWFAPWRWYAGIRPWKKWTLAVLVLAAWYIESPVVFVPIFERVTVPYVESALGVIYFPLATAYEALPVVQVFYDTQFEAVKAMLRHWGW